MKKVFKYKLQPSPEQTIVLPIEHEILSVETQNNEIVIYALVTPDDPRKDRRYVRRVAVLGTGHPTADLSNYDFLGTVSTNDTMFFWHIFVEKRY